MSRLIRAGSVALLVAVALTGCGSSGPKSLDMVQVTANVKGYVDQNYPVYPHAAPVCPTTEVVAKGTSFACTVAFGPSLLHIKVTEVDDSGTQINFVPTDAVLNVAAIDKDLARQVVAQFTGKVTVTCGTTQILIVAPGQTFDCTATDEVGTTKVVHGTVTDVAGHYTETLGTV